MFLSTEATGQRWAEFGREGQQLELAEGPESA